MAKVWVRRLSSKFAHCIKEHEAQIDVEKATAQHSAYTRAIERAGHELLFVEDLEDAPDGVFVEDQAVLLGQRALLTRSGAPSRRAESATVEASLRRFGQFEEIIRMEPEATLDGGDVLQVDRFVFVGLSGRTNEAGLQTLKRAAPDREVIPVPVKAGLHFKSACSAAGDGPVVARAGCFDLGVFGELKRSLLAVPQDEPDGANVLSLGAVTLVSSLAPKTQQILEDAGVETLAIDVSEIHKGDGALTCMSLWSDR